MAKQVQTKLPKGVDEAFVDAIQALSVEALKERIVALQMSNQENEAFKESVEYLSAKEKFEFERDRWNEVAAPIKEVSTAIKNKTKLVIERLKAKGAL